MMESGERQAVSAILQEGERLLTLARASGSSVLAGLMQAMINEARAAFTAGGGDPADGNDGASPARPQLRDRSRRLH